MEGSKCGTLGIRELVEFYHDNGYSGICITDHFTGNSPVSDDAPWAERVGFYDSIYERLSRVGEKYGLSVFFGFEFSIYDNIETMSNLTGNDFVIYNLNKDWLMANRDTFSSRPSEIFEKIRNAGGFIIHAHPFKEANYIECIRLYPRSVDAVETFNANCGEFANDFAKTYAKSYGLLETAGSDFHRLGQRLLTGMETQSQCGSIDALINAIKNRQAKPFFIHRE
jgi:hypothetical protein